MDHATTHRAMERAQRAYDAQLPEDDDERPECPTCGEPLLVERYYDDGEVRTALWCASEGCL